jgi:hypothetical protein
VEHAIENPDIRSRQFGQMILVLGGTLHLNGCECECLIVVMDVCVATRSTNQSINQ